MYSKTSSDFEEVSESRYLLQVLGDFGGDGRGIGAGAGDTDRLGVGLQLGQVGGMDRDARAGLDAVVPDLAEAEAAGTGFDHAFAADAAGSGRLGEQFLDALEALGLGFVDLLLDAFVGAGGASVTSGLEELGCGGVLGHLGFLSSGSGWLIYLQFN